MHILHFLFDLQRLLMALGQSLCILSCPRRAHFDRLIGAGMMQFKQYSCLKVAIRLIVNPTRWRATRKGVILLLLEAHQQWHGNL